MFTSMFTPVTAPSISKVRASLIAAVLAVAPLAPACHAQDAGVIAKVNVPFAFQTATGQHFSPGVYTVSKASPSMTIVKGRSASGFVMTLVEDDAQPAKSGKATFRKYGNQYFLSEISVAGSNDRFTFRASKAEHRLQIAQTSPAPATVEVALLQDVR